MWTAVVACGALSSLYVASLYVWSCPYDRNHPTTIKKRFLSALFMSFISPIFLWLTLTNESLDKYTLLEHMGFRIPGLFQAMLYPLLLTALLFLGPITMFAISGIWRIYAEPIFWWNCFNDLAWLRNHVVAPLSEEFTYRSCMMPILLQHSSPLTSVFIGPLYFGLAHFHHAFEKLKSGQDVTSTIRDSLFQFSYTTLFGTYSAFLFARTGHFVAPLIAHIFCNLMGFPNFGTIHLFPRLQCIFICVQFIIGLILWVTLLFPVTNPLYYYNSIYWQIS